MFFDEKAFDVFFIFTLIHDVLTVYYVVLYF